MLLRMQKTDLWGESAKMQMLIGDCLPPPPFVSFMHRKKRPLIGQIGIGAIAI